jgi:Xaa-Pro aminopeptidase
MSAKDIPMPFDFPARRERIVRALGLTDEILLIGAGHPVPKPEISDALLPFIAHQEYYYLTGHAEAIGGILVHDPRTSEWVSFVPEVTEMDRVWEGREQLPGELLARFPDWFATRRGRPVVMLGAPIGGIAPDEGRTAAVREAYKHARRPKEPAEIELLKRGAAATAAGYALIPPLLQPGVSERQLQIELEAEYFRHGAQATGYDTIIGIGPQSAVFHGSPSPDRVAKAGDFILIDSGAQVDRYVTDVTRTYAVGKVSSFQRDLYQAVLGAQERTCEKCRPGVEWKDLHFATAADLMCSLAAMGVVRGDPHSLVEQEVHTLFYPHGLGHMVGLGVRDASGLEPGRVRDPRPGLRSLRMDLVLRKDYVVTVEPGLYFIPAILRDFGRRARYPDVVNWSLVDRYLHIGGVRIEDNILVTDGAPVNLTGAIPKTLG